MEEALSQLQIDALLQDLVGGQANDIPTPTPEEKKKSKVKAYNFKLPKKFTKEQLRTIHSVFEVYARHLSSYLTGTLRTFVQVEPLSIEETKFYEYSNSLPESVLLGELEMAPFDGTILMEFSKDLSFAIMDKLLGGQGAPGVVVREYTDIEVSIMDVVFKNAVYYLKDAWSNIVDVAPSFKKAEVNNGTNRVMHLDEIVVICMLEVKIKEVTGTITVCLPYTWLEPISEKLFTKYRMAERIRKDINVEENRRTIKEQIYHSSIELKAKLGTTKLGLIEVANLRPGDIIKLDQKAEDFIKIEVAKKDWFNARLGVKSRSKAVQIINGIDNE